MIRLTTSALVAFLLVGCGGNPQIDLQSGPRETFEHAAPAESKPAAFALLGIEPGRTKLEEFRSRFKAGEPQETAAKGVQTAEAGPEANLSADGLKVTRLKVAALDGVVFQVIARVESQSSPVTWVSSALGQPEDPKADVIRWKSTPLYVTYAAPLGELTLADPSRGVESLKRGFETLEF